MRLSAIRGRNASVVRGGSSSADNARHGNVGVPERAADMGQCWLKGGGPCCARRALAEART